MIAVNIYMLISLSIPGTLRIGRFLFLLHFQKVQSMVTRFQGTKIMVEGCVRARLFPCAGWEQNTGEEPEEGTRDQMQPLDYGPL